MGTTAQKLNRVLQTKSDLKTVINYSGANITNETTFKDYSKLLNKAYIDILNDEGDSLYNALPKTTATGSNLTLNTEKGKMKITLKGDTQQNTFNGINLIKFPNIAETTANGITYSIQDDVISLNGTATGNIRYLYASNFAFDGAGDYRITLIPISGNYTRGVIGISSRTEDKSTQIVWQQVADGGMTNKKTYTAENITQIKNIGIYINSGSVLNNLKFKFMFTKGDSIPTTFEPYVGGSFSPNPDYPQNIDVVTGEQNIQVVGKNLFDKDTITTGYYISNTGEINSNNNFAISDFISVIPNNIYTYLGTHIQSNYGGKAGFYDKNKNWISSLSLNLSETFVVPNNAYYFRTSLQISQNDQNTFQLEKGSTSTTYEPYQSQNYPVNLGKNLFDKDNANYFNAYISVGSRKIVAGNDDRTIYIECKPNTTYTIQKMVQETTDRNRFVVGTTSSIPQINDVMNDFHYYNGGTTNTTLTLTTGANANYLCMFCWSIDTITTFEDILDSIQIEVGSQATDYVSYFEPIELCKIGSSQDYIYNQNGDWYLHKEIGKENLNGSENWTNNEEVKRFRLNLSQYIGNTSNNSLTGYLTNYFNEITPGQTLRKNEGFCFDMVSALCIWNNYASSEDLTGFKNWLSSHNLLFYGVLKTPQDIQITNAALIQQLDNLKNAKSYDGVTHITQTNTDLPFNLEVSALAKIE